MAYHLSVMAASCYRSRVMASLSRRYFSTVTETSKPLVGRLFPEYDPGKYIVTLEGDGFKFRSNKEFLEYYVNTLKDVVGSKEKAKKKIYFVSTEWYDLCFGAEIDAETCRKLQGLANVGSVLEDFDDVARQNCSFVCSDFPINWKGRLHNMFSYQKSSKKLAQLNTSGDSGHWLIHIDKPNGEIVDADQILDHCVKLLSKFVGSERKARDRIYVIWCVEPLGFGAEMDKATSKLLKGSPGVKKVLQDYAFDIKDKESGTLVISPSDEDGDPDIDYYDIETESESDSCSDDDESEHDQFSDDDKSKF